MNDMRMIHTDAFDSIKVSIYFCPRVLTQALRWDNSADRYFMFLFIFTYQQLIHDSEYILDDSIISITFAGGRMNKWQFEDKRAEILSNYGPGRVSICRRYYKGTRIFQDTHGLRFLLQKQLTLCISMVGWWFKVKVQPIQIWSPNLKRTQEKLEQTLRDCKYFVISI